MNPEPLRVLMKRILVSLDEFEKLLKDSRNPDRGFLEDQKKRAQKLRGDIVKLLAKEEAKGA